MLARFTRFSYAIAEISRHWHHLTAEEMEKYGLKSAHCVYLLTMNAYPDGITAPQLGTLCGKDKADVSRMMAIMERKGLVTKESIYQNRYGGIFRLTEAGISAARKVGIRAQRAVELAGRDLTPESRTIFYTALESIAANLRQLSETGIPEPEQENIA